MVKCLPAMQETEVQSLGQEILWRRKWQLTPVFLPGKSHGRRSLVGLQLSDFTSSLVSSSKRIDQDRGELVRQGSGLQELLERPTA